jgi:CDP-diglyceride synthetase
MQQFLGILILLCIVAAFVVPYVASDIKRKLKKKSPRVIRGIVK